VSTIKFGGKPSVLFAEIVRPAAFVISLASQPVRLSRMGLKAERVKRQSVQSGRLAVVLSQQCHVDER
jgi:hypothetical protein